MAPTFRLASALAVVSSLAACGPSGAASVGTSKEPLAPTWTSVGFGINRATVGAGPNVLVVYGGYTATDADSEALALEHVSVEVGAMGVGRAYAVRGPRDAGYDAREIGNSHLAAELAGMAGTIGFVAVIAHSSGAFVADELFTQVNAQVLSKIVYFDLDGGSWALTSTMVGQMAGVYFTNANDRAAGNSANYAAIVSLHSSFPASHIFTVDSTGSGCDVGAGWCLHDTLITTRPHNHATYDLADDYADFTGAGRHLVTAEIEQAIADGALPGGTTPPVDAGTGGPPAGDCSLAGRSYPANTCTETLQCDAGAWVSRSSDTASCAGGAMPDGACVTDTGSVVPLNTCTQTLQCDNSIWVSRADDPAACL